MAKEKKVFRSNWVDLGNGRTVHVLQRSSLADMRKEEKEKRGDREMIAKVINPKQKAEIQQKLRLETMDEVKPLPAKVRGASPSGEVDFAAFIGPVTPVK